MLLYILNEIRGKRRDRLNPEDIKRLEKEDRAEERELQLYAMQTVAMEGRVLAPGSGFMGVEKRLVPRQSGECFLGGFKDMGIRC